MPLKTISSKLNWKLSLAIVGLGGLIAASVGAAAYMTASSSLRLEASDRLSAALGGRKAALESYLASIGEDLRFVASHPWTLDAVQDFDRAWDGLGGRQTETLQRLYIEDNPHPTGKKDDLDRASDESAYSDRHATYHPWFRHFLRERGYYDIFLFDVDGNLLYTVFKELDYATNVSTGPYQDTDLANAFRSARANPKNSAASFFDFQPYSPSHGAPASFISAPIFGPDDRLEGVLVFQMPIDRLNAVLQETAGLGTTGESYLVGQDGLMRTDSRFSIESTILKRKVENQAVKKALQGQSGVVAVANQSGDPALAAFAPIEFGGVTWAMVAEIPLAEVLASVDALLWRVAGITALALLCLAAAGWYLGRSIALPLQALATTVVRLSRGENADIAGADRSDEIGDMARSLNQVYRKGLEATRLRSALDSCQANVMVANRNREIIYLNPNLQRMLKSVEQDIRKDLPHFSADELLGVSIDVFHKNPAHQHRVLDELKTAHHAALDIGGRKMAFVASPVLGEKGERLGTVVEWQDQTAELGIREEIDGVIAAANRGDLSRRVPLEGKQGFMLQLAKGMNQLTDLIEQVTHDVGSVLEGFADGDLTRRITSDYHGSFGALKENVNTSVGQLSQIVSDIQALVSEVRSAAGEITAGSDDLAKRTEQAAASIEETAAASEQMSATVKQNAANAKNADQLSGSANETASQGGHVVERAVAAMSGIEESARKITDIIGVIDEIAFQTNLLALNASVEAARAGEAGKGFAVVAQEVRQLAQRSAQAADDIKGLIQGSNGQVRDGVELVNQAGGALSDILGSIGQVASIIREIADASQEQAIGVQEINGSITTMDEMTQQNSSLVEGNAVLARSLNEQAQKLTDLMGFFKLDSAFAQAPQAKRPSQAPEPRQAQKAPALQTASANDGWNDF